MIRKRTIGIWMAVILVLTPVVLGLIFFTKVALVVLFAFAYLWTMLYLIDADDDDDHSVQDY